MPCLLVVVQSCALPDHLVARFDQVPRLEIEWHRRKLNGQHLEREWVLRDAQYVMQQRIVPVRAELADAGPELDDITWGH